MLATPQQESSTPPTKLQKTQTGQKRASSDLPIPSEQLTIVETSAPTPLLVKRLSEKAKLPIRGSALAAGYDLCSAADVTIPAHNRAIVPTDLSIAVPPGTYGRVAPRSGLAVKHFIDTGAGVIDADYRGPVGVVLFNFGDKDFEVKEGDRIAQLILERIEVAEIQEVESLDDTTRGAGGFGSTGGHAAL